MHSDAHSNYLEAQVLTATPQKQRLMLIDAAIRSSCQTLQFWNEGRHEEAFDAVTLCRDIISELLSSIRVAESELTQRVAGIYLFLFQTLTEVQWERSPQKLQEVIDILRIERETWQLVCEQLPHAPTPSAAQSVAGLREILAPREAYPDANQFSGGFSLEA